MIPNLEPWVVDRLHNEHDYVQKLLLAADRKPTLRTSSRFGDEVENADESLEFALHVACDGEPKDVFDSLGFDYSATTSGRPVQRLALRNQLLEALLSTQPGAKRDESPVTPLRDVKHQQPNGDGRPKRYRDAFISHATEDKKTVVRPLVNHLMQFGCRVWYDELEMKVGDSIRESVDRALALSRYGIVIISPAFIEKRWTQYELNGLLSREIEGQKVILPVWHNVTKEDILKYSPSLVDKIALMTNEMSIAEIAASLIAIINH